MKRHALSLFAMVVLALVCWQFAGMLWGFGSPLLGLARGISLAIACLLFGSALVLAARRWRAGVWIAVGLFILAVLCLPVSTILAVFPASGPEPYGSPEALTLFLIPSISFIVVALLLYSSHNLFVFLLGTLLLAKALHSVYWLTVWDNTTDPLGTFWLVFPIFAAIFSGVVLAIILTGRMKLLGIGYSLLITALLIAVSACAQRVDIRQLTEERAERVSQAIESYYSREGVYPQYLRQLFPKYALFLPGPAIIFGQDWCYDGGDDYYRLGYVDREHWSDPRLIGRIYQTAGEMPDLHPMCAQEAAALHERYQQYPYTYWKEVSKEMITLSGRP